MRAPPTDSDLRQSAADSSAEQQVGSGWMGDLLSTQKLLPVRYRIREDDNGRSLTCVEAPNITVRLDRGFSVSPSAARKYPEGSIFLDGAAQGEPFMDVERKVYNLDHHEGCVRPFTLATCEQAMVVILKGLDLRGGEWSLYGNEPDFDTVLAVWLLLNHRRITGEDSEIRGRLMPLVRLEGVIDAHGLELLELAGFPPGLRDSTFETIDRLRAHERELKRSGSWQSTDPLDYTLVALQEIDQLVYSARHFEGMEAIEEVARVALGGDRVGIVCKTDLGIYEVEKHLRKLHGERVGVIVLEKDSSTFTVRQVDPFLPKTLEPVYERLNQLDPGVSWDRRWGGSVDIGGSPRGAGSRLSALEIARICQWVFRPPSTRQRLGSIAAIGAVAVAVVVGSALAAAGGRWWVPQGDGLVNGVPLTGLQFGGAVLAASVVFLWLLVRKGGRSRSGVRNPVGWSWAALAPAVVLAALAGGAWLAGTSSADQQPVWWVLAATVVTAASCEALFRGSFQGALAAYFNIAWPGGRWFVSVPAGVAALLSGLLTPVLFGVPSWLLPSAALPLRLTATVVSAILLGLVCGVARERWSSLWPPVVLHVCAAAAAVLILSLL